jgi:hypothetical protein
MARRSRAILSLLFDFEPDKATSRGRACGDLFGGLLIDFNLDELKLLFDEMLPSDARDAELGSFSFRDTRKDGTKVFFSVNQVEEHAIVVIKCISGVCTTSMTISSCKEVRVVDDAIGHRVVELYWEDGRSQSRKAVLELDGDPILKMEV